MELNQKELGQRIAKIRKEHGLTLRQLSDKTGISAGFLSKIENGACDPSISNVQKICLALHVTVNELTAMKTEPELLSTIYKDRTYVLRKAERCLIYGFGDAFRLETLFVGNPAFKVNVMTLMGGPAEQTHCVQVYDNFCMVAKGRLAIAMENGSRYELEEGDSIMIRAEQQHAILNLSDDECVSYWIEIKNT